MLILNFIKELTNFEEFSRLYNQKFKNRNTLNADYKILLDDEAIVTQSNFQKDDPESGKLPENESLTNHKFRTKKRSEQMKKRLDKISGDRFVFKQDNNHDDSPSLKLNFELLNHEIVGNKEEVLNIPIDMEEDKIEDANAIPNQGAKRASVSYQLPTNNFQSLNQNGDNRKKKFSIHRNTNSIIGYEKEEGIIIETCQKKTKESSITINEDNNGGKSLPVEANKEFNGSVLNKSIDQLNVSNLDNSFVISESEVELTTKPLTEGQQIIVSNSILNGNVTSFIPIKNNLNLINLQKTSNVTDSYLMALGGGKASPDQTSIDIKTNLVDEIIEEEESFQESEAQTPCRFNSGIRYGSQQHVSSLELKKHPVSSFMNSQSKELNSALPLNLISSFSNPINLNIINSVCPEKDKVSCFSPIDNSFNANLNYSSNNLNSQIPIVNLEGSPYKLTMIINNNESLKEYNEGSNFQVNNITLNSNANNISNKTNNRNLNNSESWNSSKLNQHNPSGQINQKQSQKALANKVGHTKILFGELISKHTIETSNKEQKDSLTNNNYNSQPTISSTNTGINKSKLRTKITHSKSDGRQISELLFKNNPLLLTKYNKEYCKASTPIKRNECKDQVLSSKTEKKSKLKYIQNLAIDIDEMIVENQANCSKTCKKNDNPMSSKLLKTYNTIFSTKNSTPKALISNSKHFQFQSELFNKENCSLKGPGLANSKTQKLIPSRKALEKDEKTIVTYSTKSLKHVKNSSLREDKVQNKQNTFKEDNKESINSQGRAKDLHAGSNKSIVNHHIKLYESNTDDRISHKAEAKTYYLSYLEKKIGYTHIKTGSQEVQSKINFQPDLEKATAAYSDIHKTDFPSSTTISDTNTTSIIESKNNGSNPSSNVAFIDSHGKNQPSTCKSLISKGAFINDFKSAINKRNSFMTNQKAMSPGFKYKNSFSSKSELDNQHGLLSVKCSVAPVRKSTILTISIPNIPGCPESKYSKCKSSDKKKAGV